MANFADLILPGNYVPTVTEWRALYEYLNQVEDRVVALEVSGVPGDAITVVDLAGDQVLDNQSVLVVL